MIWALWLSKPLRYAVIGLCCMLAYEAWKIHQRNIGASVLKQEIKKEADANAKQADEVRDAVAAAKPGRLRAKYERGSDQ